MSDKLTVGDRIKKIRIDQGHSQDHYASLIGIGRSLLAQIERNNTKPSLSVLSKIVKISNISFEYLIDGVNTQANTQVNTQVYGKVIEENAPEYEVLNKSDKEKELEKQVEYYKGKVEALMAVIKELSKVNTAIEVPKKGSKSA
jgi:transcriptional regulator with XRE-family HTH domain